MPEKQATEKKQAEGEKREEDHIHLPPGLPDVAQIGDHHPKEESAVITMQAEAQKRAGIQTAPARSSSMPDYLDLTGTVQPIESRIAHLRALARGRVEQVLVRIGEHVKAGQPVARFDNIEAGELSAQLSSAKSDLAKLKIQEATAARQAERTRRLVAIGASAQKDLEASQAEQQGLAEAIRAQQSSVAGLESRLKRFGVDSASTQSSITLLRAPFSGVVLDIESAPGAVVDSSNELLAIADLSSVYVDAQVYEKDLGRVRVGQSASAKTDSYPGTDFAARVTSIGDQIDPQTRTTPVRCQVMNREGKLKLNMFATVALPTASQHSGIAVPADAVQSVEDKQVVFVRRSQTQFEIRQVKLGRAAGEGKIEIASGVKDGEEVVTKGAFQLKSALLSKELGEED